MSMTVSDSVQGIELLQQCANAFRLSFIFDIGKPSSPGILLNQTLDPQGDSVINALNQLYDSRIGWNREGVAISGDSNLVVFSREPKDPVPWVAAHSLVVS